MFIPVVVSGAAQYRRLKEGGFETLQDAWCESTMFPRVDVSAKDGSVALRPGPNGIMRLTVYAGYKTDGPSAPFDWEKTPDFQKGGWLHDGWYELCRNGVLNTKARGLGDEMLVSVCRAEGMSLARCLVVYAAVRIFGRSSAVPQPEIEEKVLEAP